MRLLLPFAAVLLLAVLLSALAHRTVLSATVLFLAAGSLLGDVAVSSTSPPRRRWWRRRRSWRCSRWCSSTGCGPGWSDLRSAWRLPGRALGRGLSLTLLITAALAHWVAGLGWPESLLIGAILAPFGALLSPAFFGGIRGPAGCLRCSRSWR